jgi:para-aminobenzoate synthetase/4-amino-4-deoxychorismate lyase
MNAVAELESTPRALYTGALGFASPVAGLELSVAIRTFEFQDDRVWLGVGGGIVADSDPAAEAAECLVKAAPLLEAIGGTFAAPRPATGSVLRPPLPYRLGPRPVPRPEPRAGVFETLLVRDGQAIDRERHLRRLGSSVAALYGAALPADLEAELLAAAWHLDTGRLRVDIRPSDPGLEFEIVTSPLPRRASPVTLRPVTVAGGLGDHKWSDRRLLDALVDAAEGEPLLCDLDGLVLEAARANVFAVEPGPSLVTPRADGRILPGVSRARVIELAHELGLEVREEALPLVALARADELFVTGSVGGVEPAMLEGLPPIGPPPVTARLTEAWLAWLDSTPRARVPRPGPAPLHA